jgi:hypothetical protein
MSLLQKPACAMILPRMVLPFLGGATGLRRGGGGKKGRIMEWQNHGSEGVFENLT